MINFAKFKIIRRIGEIDAKQKVTNVSVCANYRRRGEGDQWIEDSYWNRVVIFSDGQRKYIDEKAQAGDLVRIAARPAHAPLSHPRDHQRQLPLQS